MSKALASLMPGAKAAPKWKQAIAHAFRPYDLVSPEDEAAGRIPQFRHLPNFIECWGLQAITFALIALIAPKFWHSQMQSGWLVLFATFLACAFFITAPWEWFFHRFALHGLLGYRAMPWLKIVPEEGTTGITKAWRHFSNSMTIAIVYRLAKMNFGHGAHHKITDVTPVNPTRLSEMFSAINKYEIMSNDQTEHAVFPHFSLVGFWIFFLPMTAVLQLIATAITTRLHAPHIPVILGAMLAMSWQVWVYENSHAIMHQPYATWWKPRIEKSVFGKFYSHTYRFHFFHHMNEKSSQGVVGAIWFSYFWDKVFGTYKLARIELIEAASVVTRDVLELTQAEIRMLPGATPEDFEAPSAMPAWVRFLDKQADLAKERWNELFVDSLKEVRRRAKVGSNTPGGSAPHVLATKQTA